MAEPGLDGAVLCRHGAAAWGCSRARLALPLLAAFDILASVNGEFIEMKGIVDAD